MVLKILVGRRSDSHSRMRCDLVTWQSIKEWHRFRLISNLGFWAVEMVDGAITSQWLVVSSQQSIYALNSYGQLLLDKDNAIRVVLFITIFETNKRYHVCHDRFMNFKMNRYHSKSDEIHEGLGITKSTKFCLDDRLLYIFQISQLRCGSFIFTENLREIFGLLEKLQGFICWKSAIAVSWEARDYLHTSEKVKEVDSKVTLIMSNRLFFNWKY